MRAEVVSREKDLGFEKVDNLLCGRALQQKDEKVSNRNKGCGSTGEGVEEKR